MLLRGFVVHLVSESAEGTIEFCVTERAKRRHVEVTSRAGRHGEPIGDRREPVAEVVEATAVLRRETKVEAPERHVELLSADRLVRPAEVIRKILDAIRSHLQRAVADAAELHTRTAV